MKKGKKGVFLLTSTILFFGLSTAIFNSPSVSSAINNNANDVKVYKVSNYDELEEAIFKSSQQSDDKESKILLTDDINLAGWNGNPKYSDLAGDLAINGNGHSIYGKPKQYYGNPILVNEYTNGSPSTRVKIENLVLDDSPVLIDKLNQTAITDYNATSNWQTDDALVWSKFKSTALWFNNITIENIDFTNQTISTQKRLTPNRGLLVNHIRLYESGYSNSDNGIYIGNILIKDNTISDNTFVLNPSSASHSFSLITNIQYDVCYNSTHHHKGYVWIENISITNNRVYNNYLKWDDSINKNQNVSFSNILGQLSGLENWTGTSGNFLNIKNIVMENNIYEVLKPNLDMNSNDEVINSYAEILSQPSSTSTTNQRTKVDDFKNILVLNNLVFTNYDKTDSSKNVLLDQSQITVVNMEDSGDNEWNANASNTMIFVGPNYNKDKTLNVMGYDSASLGEFNSVTHTKYLSTTSQGYSQLNKFLQRHFGIYGYILKVRTWQFADGSQQDVLTKVTLPFQDSVDIIQWTPQITSEGNITNIEVKFKFSLASTFNFDNSPTTINPIKEPLTISNPELLQGDNAISSPISETEIIPSSDSNYVYNVNFSLANITNVDQIDINNLFIKFDYNTSNKASSTFKAKIDPEDISNSIMYVPSNPIKENGSKTASIVLGSVLGFISLVLLIILLIFLYRRYKVSKVGDVQDGFLEFVAEAEQGNYNYSSSDYFENNSNYYDNQNYDYSEENYDNQNYNYENYSNDYYDEYYDDYQY